jgi:sec-independent protein translocase protein TatB
VLGLTFDKLLIVAVIAAFVIGPERLPGYAAKLGGLVRTLRDFANGAKTRMREEMGPEFDEVDWKKLDPRQYDPRRIIREALLEDSPAPTSSIKPVTQSAYAQRAARALPTGAVPPFDSEST